MKLTALPFSLPASVIFNQHPVLTSRLCSTLSPQDPPLSEDFAKQWDPRVGFTILYGPYANKNKFVCKAEGSDQFSEYIPLRQSESRCWHVRLWYLYFESFFAHYPPLVCSLCSRKSEDHTKTCQNTGGRHPLPQLFWPDHLQWKDQVHMGFSKDQSKCGRCISLCEQPQCRFMTPSFLSSGQSALCG